MPPRSLSTRGIVALTMSICIPARSSTRQSPMVMPTRPPAPPSRHAGPSKAPVVASVPRFPAGPGRRRIRSSIDAHDARARRDAATGQPAFVEPRSRPSGAAKLHTAGPPRLDGFGHPAMRSPGTPPWVIPPECRSALLDDEQAVAVRVAEEEHRGHGISHAHDLRIHVDAPGLQICMDGIDVVGVEADASLDARRLAFARRNQRDRGRRPARCHLDPAVTITVRDVGSLLQAEGADVEVEGAILIDDWDDHSAHLGDLGPCLHVSILLRLCSCRVGPLLPTELIAVEVEALVAGHRLGSMSCEPSTSHYMVMAGHERSAVRLRIRGPIRKSDLPGLCRRACRLLDHSDAALVLCDARGVDADAVSVDALARLQLAARRRGGRVRLRRASIALRELVAFMGLADVLTDEVTTPAAPGGRTAGTVARCRGRR